MRKLGPEKLSNLSRITQVIACRIRAQTGTFWFSSTAMLGFDMSEVLGSLDVKDPTRFMCLWVTQMGDRKAEFTSHFFGSLSKWAKVWVGGIQANRSRSRRRIPGMETGGGQRERQELGFWGLVLALPPDSLGVSVGQHSHLSTVVKWVNNLGFSYHETQIR